MNSESLAPKLGLFPIWPESWPLRWGHLQGLAGGARRAPSGKLRRGSDQRDGDPHSTEMWSRSHAVVTAPQVERLGAKTQEHVPRPFQGLLSTMGSFLKRLMSPRQQEETSLHRPGKGPVLLSTLLVSLHLVSSERLHCTAGPGVTRYSPCSHHQGQTCMEHPEHAKL